MSALPSKPAAEAVATREQVVAILELLETRMLWSTARPIISATGIHVSRGWRETLAHAREDSYSDAIWTSAFKSLSTAARWHTYVGNKHVSFFDLREQNEDAKAQVLEWALKRVCSTRVAAAFDDLSAEALDLVGRHAAEVVVQRLAGLQLLAVDQQGSRMSEGVAVLVVIAEELEAAGLVRARAIFMLALEAGDVVVHQLGCRCVVAHDDEARRHVDAGALPQLEGLGVVTVAKSTLGSVASASMIENDRYSRL